jgi:uncharacterized protein YegJ (DUF2314 family)
MTWIVVGIVAVLAIGGCLYWKRRQKQQSRLISFVALLREPVSFDPAILARQAGKAWDADLGDGSTEGSEGADGFVVGVGLMNTIMHGERMFLVNCIPSPYIENVDEVAEGISDLRTRELFRQHRGWFSCDAMGVDGTTPEEEVRDWYRVLAKLFAELLDDNTLLIFLPDTHAAFPVNEETTAALLSDDPIAGLQGTLNPPIIEVSGDDPAMKQAVAQARQEWPKFVAAFEKHAGDKFAVKAPVSHGNHTEFIWLTVTTIEGARVYGTLANEPGNLGPLKLGSKVSVLAADLNDWCYLDAQGNLVGGFTIQVVMKASQQKRPK